MFGLAFLLVDRQRLQHIDAETGEIGNFQGNVEEGRAHAGFCNRKGPDMELVDDHVGKIRRDEILVVPGKAGAAQNAKTVRKIFGIELAGARVALMAAGALALHPEAIAVAVARAVLVSGPVAARVFLHQPLVGELVEHLSAKNAMQIDRLGLRRPEPKGRAFRIERRAGRRLRGNMRL